MADYIAMADQEQFLSGGGSKQLYPIKTRQDIMGALLTFNKCTHHATLAQSVLNIGFVLAAALADCRKSLVGTSLAFLSFLTQTGI